MRHLDVGNLWVRSGLARVPNLDKKPVPHYSGALSQFVHKFPSAYSSFEYLLQYVIVAVDVMVLLAERRDGPARVQNRRMVAVAERVTDVR